MKKESIRLSRDLIWNIKRDAKSQNKNLDGFVRELHEFWKNYHHIALNEVREVKK